MKKMFSVVAVIIGLSLMGASCSFTSAGIESTTMATAVNDTTQEAVDSATSFATDVGTIYASVKITNAPSDTKVIGKWFYGEESLGEKEVTIEGTRFIGFRITKGVFDEGDYKFVVTIDGSDKTQETEFTVVEATNNTTEETTTDTTTDTTTE